MAKEIDNKGLYVGEKHVQRGIPVVVDGAKPVEVEGLEYKICESAYNSDAILKFENQTNLEVLDSIHDNFSCRFKQNDAKSGDFILCRLVVGDKKTHNRKGTVKQILDKMQEEQSCRLSNGIVPDKAEFGGPLGKTSLGIYQLELPKGWTVNNQSKTNGGVYNYAITDPTKSVVIMIEYFDFKSKYSVRFIDLNQPSIIPLNRYYESKNLNSVGVNNEVKNMAGFLQAYIDDKGKKAKKLSDGGGLSDEKYYIISLNGRPITKFLGSEITKPDGTLIDVITYLSSFGYKLKRVKKSDSDAFDPSIGTSDLENLYRRVRLFIRNGNDLLKQNNSARYFSELQSLGLSPVILERMFLKGLYIGKKTKYYIDREKTDYGYGEIVDLKPINEFFDEITLKNDEDSSKITVTSEDFDDDDFYVNIYGNNDSESKKKEVVVCRVKATETDRCLLLKRGPTQSEPNMWHLLSGTVDSTDNNDRHTIKREVYEETGYKGGFEKIEFFDVVFLEDTIVRYYEVDVPHEFECKLNSENCEFSWIKINEILHYDLLPVFEHYILSTDDFFKAGGKVGDNRYDLRITDKSDEHNVFNLFKIIFVDNNGKVDKLKLDNSINDFTDKKVHKKYLKAFDEYKEYADVYVEDGYYISYLLQHNITSSNIAEEFEKKYGVGVTELADAYNKNVEEYPHQEFYGKRLYQVFEKVSNKKVHPDEEDHEYEILVAEFLSALGQLGIKLKKPVDRPNIEHIQTFSRPAKPIKTSGIKSLGLIVADDENGRVALRGVYVDGDRLIACDSYMLVSIKDDSYKKHNHEILDPQTGNKLSAPKDYGKLVYPDYKSLVPVNYGLTNAIDIDDAIAMANGVVFTFKNVERSIPQILMDFDDVRIALNAEYLFNALQVLKANSSKQISFEFEDSDISVIINTDNGNYALVMPVIIGDGPCSDPKRFEMTDNLSALNDRLKALESRKGAMQEYSEQRLIVSKKNNDKDSIEYHTDKLKELKERKANDIKLVKNRIKEVEDKAKSKFSTMYYILVDDTLNTHNINMHSYDTLAKNKDEALEKMYKHRPEFTGRKILSIKHDDFNSELAVDYEDADYKKSVDSTFERISGKSHEIDIPHLIKQYEIALGAATRANKKDKAKQLGTRLKFLKRAA